MSDKDNKDTAIYPEDKDWANYTVDLNDGWADDVSLMYPDESWKPDDDELTIVSIEESEDNDNELLNDENDKKHKRLSKFAIFLMLWSLLLISVTAILLFSFYDRLERYETAYTASLPDSYVQNFISLYSDNEIDAIYGQITSLPSLSEFENDISLKTVIAKDCVSGNVTYRETDYDDDYTYDILINSKKVAAISIRTAEAKSDEFGLPTWYISSFEYLFIPLDDFYINAPKNANVYINDILLTDDYCYKEDSNNKYYIIGGLFIEPSIIALIDEDSPLDVYYSENDNTYICK